MQIASVKGQEDQPTSPWQSSAASDVGSDTSAHSGPVSGRQGRESCPSLGR